MRKEEGRSEHGFLTTPSTKTATATITTPTTCSYTHTYIHAALHGHMSLQDLAEVDFCYAPPYSSANDPINLVAFVGMNDCSGRCTRILEGNADRV